MRSNSRLMAMLALSLLVSACGGDDSKPNKDTSGHGDGDQGDGDANGNLDGGTEGDGDDQTGSDGGGDGDQQNMDAGADAEIIVDPFEGLPDAGQDAGPDGSVISADDRLALAVEAKLRKCEVVVGAGPFNAGKVEDNYDRCVGSCITSASCSNLKNAFCGGVVNAFSNCTKACNTHPADGFLCADGVTRIRHTAVCDDGVLASDAKCPGGDDELNCEKFTCDDGDKISAKYRCDGTSVEGAKSSLFGCKDGSDEKGCAVACPAP
ncbi:MAG: hypothetical protein QM778_20460 [Myxococcales bacterium]